MASRLRSSVFIPATLTLGGFMLLSVACNPRSQLAGTPVPGEGYSIDDTVELVNINMSTTIDGGTIMYDLTSRDEYGFSGTATVIALDGTVDQSIIFIPNAMVDSQPAPDGGLQVGDDGSMWLGADGSTMEEGLPVVNFNADAGVTSFTILGDDGRQVAVTMTGESALFVCGGVCIAALVAAGALAVCGWALTLSAAQCYAKDGCWEFEFAGGNWKEKALAACTGKCVDW